MRRTLPLPEGARYSLAMRTLLATSLVVAGLLSPPTAWARDNSTRLVGVGFQLSPTMSAATPGALLSAKFAAAPTAEFSALFGLSWGEDLLSVAFGGKALLILVPEEHLNVYVAVTVLPAVGTYGLHAFGYAVGPGIAFYPPGAPNLEIFAEFGLAGATRFGQSGALPTSAGPILATTGSALLGLHYWF